VVEGLPSKCKALNSNPGTAKTNKKNHLELSFWEEAASVLKLNVSYS
jgi:hypothetical protein